MAGSAEVVMASGRSGAVDGRYAIDPPDHRGRSTGFRSTTGVPSTASRPRTCTRPPSIAATSTRCRPIGFGRSAERVVNTPRSGSTGRRAGGRAGRRGRPRCSQVRTMISSPGRMPSSPSTTPGSRTSQASGPPSKPCLGAARGRSAATRRARSARARSRRPGRSREVRPRRVRVDRPALRLLPLLLAAERREVEEVVGAAGHLARRGAKVE